MWRSFFAASLPMQRCDFGSKSEAKLPITSLMSIRLLLAVAALWLLGKPAAAIANPKKIVLIAGAKSHGPEGNGVHDYPWSVRLLKVMLDSSNVAGQVRVEFHQNGWPND